MSDFIAEFMTPQLTVAFFVVVGFFVLLYILSIVWVARDAYMRDSNWRLWALLALIPIVGVVAYCLLRPPLYQIDRDEQELEIAIKQRELQKYGECAHCGYPVEYDFIVCPNCQTQLKNMCPTCGKALNPQWSMCPYCTTMISEPRIAPQKPRQTSRRRRAQ